MRTDADILIEIDAAFGACTRPEHFCNYTHCAECKSDDVQRRAIASLLLHLIDTRAEELVGFEEDQILHAYEIWSGQAQRPGTASEQPGA